MAPVAELLADRYELGVQLGSAAGLRLSSRISVRSLKLLLVALLAAVSFVMLYKVTP